ncbi:hypothetical protein [Microvirga massiliensis]|uniref:hypothetical protein n=1 Tax=Microvirga massiliensis TaxID=1033741 RepID=UPI00062B8E36|nr:hypothetical protein [Microvirga massiliensis]
MMTPNQVRLIAWVEFEFIRRTLAVRRGGAPLHWVGTDHRMSFSEILTQAQEFGLEETSDHLREWINGLRDWSRWHEAINRMDTGQLEQELTERALMTR